MANEITVTYSFNVRKGNVNHIPASETVRATLSGDAGPYIGTINVPTTGVDVDLSSLTTMAWARIKNLDSTNRVGWGVRDPDANRFFEFGELAAGEGHPFKFSRNFLTEFIGTGTGTPAVNNKLHFRAYGSALKVLIEIFPM